MSENFCSVAVLWATKNIAEKLLLLETHAHRHETVYRFGIQKAMADDLLESGTLHQHQQQRQQQQLPTLEPFQVATAAVGTKRCLDAPTPPGQSSLHRRVPHRFGDQDSGRGSDVDDDDDGSQGTSLDSMSTHVVHVVDPSTLAHQRSAPDAFGSGSDASGDSDDDEGGLLPAIPVEQQDLPQNRHDVAHRELRTRQTYQRQQRRRKIHRWLRRWLPWWLRNNPLEPKYRARMNRELLHLFVKYESVRINVALTIGFLCLMFLAWWFLLGPLLFPSAVNPHGEVKGQVRIDSFGQVIRSWMPLCDLLYKRASFGKMRDRLALALSNLAAIDIHRLWKQSGPVPQTDALRLPGSQQQHQPPPPPLEEDADAFVSRIPDHHDQELWHKLCQDHVVRADRGAPVSESVLLSPPTPTATLRSRRGRPSRLRYSRPSDQRAFRDQTHAWLARHCDARSTPMVDEQSFAASAQGSGTIQLDVTGYLLPMSKDVRDEASTPKQQQQQQQQQQRQQESEPETGLVEPIEIAQASPLSSPSPSRPTHQWHEIMDLDDEDDGPTRIDSETDAEPVETVVVDAESENSKEEARATGEEEKEKPKDPPVVAEPVRAFRNVSIYELHVLLWHLAAQGGRATIESQTASKLEKQLGRRVAATATTFAPPVPMTHPREAEQVATSSDHWYAVVRDELASLENQRAESLLALRTASLWTGESGCVCPHHVGVPIPGAAWFEGTGPRSPELRPKVRVLFYPSSDAEQDQEQPASVASGVLNLLFSAWSSSSSSSKEHVDDVQETPPSSSQASSQDSGPLAILAPVLVGKTREIAWYASDPVLQPDRTALLQGRCPILRLPRQAVRKDWTWVEGVDYRGGRRRYRVSPRSLACILSCKHACGRQQQR